MALKILAITTIVFLMFVSVFAMPHKALACSCIAPPTTVEGIREKVKQHNLVFTGVATDVDASGTIHFRVTNMSKGPLISIVSVRGASPRPSPTDGTVTVMSNSCEWDPQIGPEYLIYAYSESDGSYSTGLCSGNHTLPLSAEEQTALGISPAPTAPSPGRCPNITRTLTRGSSGSSVMALQSYFISIGMLGSSSATGYFGPLTEGAVQEWQASHGIVSQGTPATTGWGLVGPRTRAALAACNQ